MRTMILGCLFLFLASDLVGQSKDTEPPLSDSRLSIHTLVREDIFAGWQKNDMERFTRGEKNVDILLNKRPDEKADLLAWKGGTSIYRAVLAHEIGQQEKFEKLYAQTLKYFAEARKLGPQSVGVAAVCGGAHAIFADRLPESVRADAWASSYDDYMVLWKMQGDVIEKIPVHMRGELLSGLAQSAQRTGREKELQEYLDKIIEVLPKTRYASMAKRWKQDPKAAASENISCKTCHAAGRLKRRLTQLNDK